MKKNPGDVSVHKYSVKPAKFGQLIQYFINLSSVWFSLAFSQNWINPNLLHTQR